LSLDVLDVTRDGILSMKSEKNKLYRDSCYGSTVPWGVVSRGDGDATGVSADDGNF